jgi:radical SAM protein with 4Fe4S-binding SPASM domain
MDLVEAGCTEVQICIEGSRETHNQVRGGTWNKVLKAWDICKSNGMYVVNQTTITPFNYKEIDYIVSACKGKVDRVRILRQIPHNDKAGVLTASEWMETMERVLYGFHHQKKLYNEFVIVKDIFWSKLFRSMPYRCPFSMEYSLLPIIECNGDVYICRRANVIAGNIFNDKLVNIYKDSDILKQTRKINNLNSQCKKCMNNDWCGGCRGMALAIKGDIMAEDPHCIINTNIPPWGREKMERDLMPVASGKRGKTEITVADVFNHMKITGNYAPSLLEIINSKVTAEAAKRAGVVVSTDELQRAADIFRSVRGLKEAVSAEKWLEGQNLSLETLEDFLETNLLIDKSQMNC